MDPKTTQDEKGYTPASFEKRAAAWAGVAYMLMLLGILWYALFFHGQGMPGVFPLFLVPVCVALGVVIVHRLRLGTAYGGVLGGVLALAVCVAGTALGLILGVPALIAAFTV